MTTVEPGQAQGALLKLFQDELMGVVQAMPAEKYNYTPSSAALNGSKFDGVRTFAQQAVHLAQANYYFFGSMESPSKPPVDPQSLTGLTRKEDIIKALQASFSYADAVLPSMNQANAYSYIKGVDGMHTRATVASFAVAHGFDHYGQMVEYLRMNGIVPPGSK